MPSADSEIRMQTCIQNNHQKVCSYFNCCFFSVKIVANYDKPKIARKIRKPQLSNGFDPTSCRYRILEAVPSRALLLIIAWFSPYFAGNPIYQKYIEQVIFIPKWWIDIWSRWTANGNFLLCNMGIRTRRIQLAIQ
jgi:hypothetical protein